MMRSIETEDLVAMGKVAPEIEGLKETASEWWLGLVGVDKSGGYSSRAQQTWPCWRDGFNRPVRATMTFRTAHFERPDGGPAVAVILTVPEDERELWVGWVRGEREAELVKWVDQLNAELRRLHELWTAAGRPGATR
jgi:hypothetical protein